VVSARGTKDAEDTGIIAECCEVLNKVFSSEGVIREKNAAFSKNAPFSPEGSFVPKETRDSISPFAAPWFCPSGGVAVFNFSACAEETA
jgi:hypothetical protein